MLKLQLQFLKGNFLIFREKSDRKREFFSQEEKRSAEEILFAKK